MSVDKPTMDDIIQYRTVNETGLEEARRAVWKRWRIETIKQLKEKMHELVDDDAIDLLDVLESIERVLQ